MARIEPEVKLIEYSEAMNTGIRIATFHVRYWRPIHSEVMTHRVLTRNGRSSRAVPNKVLLAEPVMEPLIYGSNRPGMSAGDELTGWRYYVARGTWLGMAHMTRLGVRVLNWVGLHKQWSNRPLEWFGAIDMQITSTDWKNWETLRISDFAMPEINLLAVKMRRELRVNKPKNLMPGEWHLPWVTDDERRTLSLELQKKLSVARSARLSYKPFDGNADHPAEVARHDKLVVSQPVHASPAEHQATPDRIDANGNWYNPNLQGNLRGWVQYRKTLPNEWIPG